MMKTTTKKFPGIRVNFGNTLSVLGTTLFLSLGTGLLYGGQTPRTTLLEPWQEKGLKNELLEKRSRTAKHFLKENGRISAYFSPSSIHYQDVNGKWQDISTEIKNYAAQNNSGTYPYLNEENAVRNYFPANPFTTPLVMSAREGAYQERIKSISFLDAQQAVISTIGLNGTIQTQVNANQIRYSGFNPHMALVYALGSDSRKFDLQILSSAFLSTIPNGAKFIRIEEEFVGPGTGTDFQASGSEISVFTAGTEVFSFSQPFAFDSNTSTENGKTGTIRVETENNKATIYSTFDLQWLSAPGRQFPVHLDPVVNYYPQNVNFWTGYQTSSTGKTNGFLRLTTATTASWAKFDLGTLPVGASVTQSTYYGYHYTTTGAAKIAHIRGLGTTDPVPSAAGAIFAASYGGTSYNNNYTFGASVFAWQPGLLNGAANSDIASAAGTWIALGFGFVSGNTSFMYQYGWNASNVNNRPYLEVDYTTTPCTGTPGANTVVAPTIAICPGTSANLSLANSYTVGGLMYTWQSSTVSSVGPWNTISTMTSAAAVTPTLGIHTWFSVIITCTNSNGSVTATSASVNVSPVILDSVLYYEGFEGIAEPDKLPNCSWAASHLGSTCKTYTSVQAQNLSPNTGFNFAAFYYSPANNNYFWTNGIWMEAGVTYSASMWYKTDYYTYGNWNLTMWLGTGQSTVGASVIKTSGGMGSAASPNYILFSDTFQVGTSGYYYVGVNGESSGACCGYNMSWDDLKISIPCEYNTPALSSVASTTQVCSGQAVVLTASGADTYLWNTGATTAVVSVTPNIPTMYSVTGENLLTGCTMVSTQFIDVLPSPMVNIFAGANSVCPGQGVLLTAFGANTYVWNTGFNGAMFNAAPTTATTYSVIGTNLAGCTGSATQAIAVETPPTVDIASSNLDGLACAEDFTELSYNGIGGVSFMWISSFSNVWSSNPIQVNPLVSTSYTLIATSVQGCTNQATYDLAVTECVGLKENGSAGKITLSPNPTSGSFLLNHLPSNCEVSVYDITGRMILEKKEVHGDQISIPLNSFEKGVYLVSVKGKNTLEVLRVIKE